jgi:alcohol dehydrogenase, propanol-preferring
VKAFRLLERGVTALQDVDVPIAGPDEVVLRVGAASFCHSDVDIVDDPTPLRIELPVTLGHEVAGSIHQIGTNVRGRVLDEPVAVYIIQGCGSCIECARGHDNRCANNVVSTPGVHRNGGMAEFVSVDARYVMPIDGIDVAQAAPLTDAGLTSYHAVDQGARWLRPGAKALVIGIGGLGHIAVQTIKAISSAKVVAVDISQDRVDLARRLGADDAVLAGPDAARDLLDGIGPIDVTFDFVGSQVTVDLAATVTRKGGAIIVTGVGDGHVPVVADMRSLGAPLGVPVVRSDTTVIRSFAGGRRDLHEVLGLARSGLLRVETTTYPLEDAAQALVTLRAYQAVGRAVVLPNG